MADCLLAQKREGCIIVNVNTSRRFMKQATMSMIRIFTKTNIGDDQQLGNSFLDGRYRLLDNSLVRIGVGAGCVFFIRQSKQQDTAQAQF